VNPDFIESGKKGSELSLKMITTASFPICLFFRSFKKITKYPKNIIKSPVVDLWDCDAT
jgi:hypothetical protein